MALDGELDGMVGGGTGMPDQVIRWDGEVPVDRDAAMLAITAVESYA